MTNQYSKRNRQLVYENLSEVLNTMNNESESDVDVSSASEYEEKRTEQ